MTGAEDQVARWLRDAGYTVQRLPTVTGQRSCDFIARPPEGPTLLVEVKALHLPPVWPPRDAPRYRRELLERLRHAARQLAASAQACAGAAGVPERVLWWVIAPEARGVLIPLLQEAVRAAGQALEGCCVVLDSGAGPQPLGAGPEPSPLPALLRRGHGRTV